MSAVDRLKKIAADYPFVPGAPCPPELMPVPGAIPMLPVQVLLELIARVEKLEDEA